MMADKYKVLIYNDLNSNQYTLTGAIGQNLNRYRLTRIRQM
jgi:hypothetical protein